MGQGKGSLTFETPPDSQDAGGAADVSRCHASGAAQLRFHMSCSLNSLKRGLYRGLYRGLL